MTARSGHTGEYRGTFTASAANGFEVGKWYSVKAYATVGGLAGIATEMHFRLKAAEATAGYLYATVKDGTGTGEIDTSAGTVITRNLGVFPRGVAFANYPFRMYNDTTGALVTGLSTSDITCKIFKDGGAAATSNDTTETETDSTNKPGEYMIDLSAGELTSTVTKGRCKSATATAQFEIYPQQP